MTEEKKEKVNEVKKTSPKETNFKIDINEMVKAGLNFGHRTSRLHPKMSPYIEGIKNTVHVIDLAKTAQELGKALKFIQEIVVQDKVMLVVGTKIQVKELVKEIAEECDLPYVSERWLGGTLTNFPVVSQRVGYLKDLEKKKSSGEWDKYTKKEKIKMNKDLSNLKIKFDGLKKLERVPDCLLVLDIKKDDLAVKEAKMKGIKIVAITDTNTDPSLVDYPIPANDDAVSSVKYILDKIKEVIKKSKK